MRAVRSPPGALRQLRALVAQAVAGAQHGRRRQPGRARAPRSPWRWRPHRAPARRSGAAALTCTGTTTPTTPSRSGWPPCVTLAQQGDGEAFGQVYDAYVGAGLPLSLLPGGLPPLAEDLTSETFLRALRRIDSFTWQGRDIGAWFITIARNLVTDH